MPAKKQVTKEMILSAAMKLLQENGIEAVNVKALARALNCSTQPIYLSFSGMDELRAELIKKAVRAFTQNMDSASANLFGMSYIRFAMEEKELFRFLFMRPNAFREIKEALTPIIERSIAELMSEYHIDHEEGHYLHDQLWMQAHGIAAMIATEFCDWNTDKIAGMLADCKVCLGRKYGV